MEQILICPFYHPLLNIAMQDVKNVWLLNNPPVLLQATLHRGALYYRLPKTGKRISYRQLKTGLIRKVIRVSLPCYPLPF